jgi:hypothetical protein
MRERRKHRFHALRAAVAIAIVAALMRALVPVGYMAALDERGLTLVACSGVIAVKPGLAHDDAHAHHGAHGAGGESGKDDPSTAEHLAACPFAASGNSVLASHIEPPAPSAAFSVRAPATPHAPLVAISAASFAPRGPPAFI